MCNTRTVGICAKYDHIVWLNPDKSLWGVSEEERQWADRYMGYMRETYNMISKEYNNIPDKPVDYSEVMAAVQKTGGFKKQAVMKEMLSKLSQPILQNDKTN